MSARDMVARHSNYEETRDFIPTPPFATRALYEHAAPELKDGAHGLTAWDPAAGHGHMTRVFKEYGHREVFASDLEGSPAHGVHQFDFLDPEVNAKHDVIITNPPYKHADLFVQKALRQARYGVGMLVRVQALEGQRRYARLYRDNPPTQIAFFADRIPFKQGIVVRKASKMFFHVWLWWNLQDPTPRAPLWIPPDVQRRLEKDEDYE